MSTTAPVGLLGKFKTKARGEGDTLNAVRLISSIKSTFSPTRTGQTFAPAIIKPYGWIAVSYTHLRAHET